ncbi:hypothetical protein MPCS_01815 (plasmid) [Candidatus Megaera polyxenophila]|nr:hypothetical protein MPCS_01815 [Candidatus Megaera polyxenophila]
MHNSNNSALSKDTIFGAKNHTNINSILNSASRLEDISVAKARETLRKMLLPTKEAVQVFSNLEQAKLAVKIYNERQAVKLPTNITETPKFHEAKSESLELSDSAKETLAKVGERARAKSLDEQIEEARAHFKQTFTKEQTRRARKYNIPFDANSVDYHQLSRKIDQYEFLLDEAKRWDISWDIKIYDPAALEQELEEARSRYWGETSKLRSDYYSSRRVAV